MTYADHSTTTSYTHALRYDVFCSNLVDVAFIHIFQGYFTGSEEYDYPSASKGLESDISHQVPLLLKLFNPTMDT